MSHNPKVFAGRWWLTRCVCVPTGPPCHRGPWRGWRGLRDVCHSPCVEARRSMSLSRSWRNRWPSRRTAARTAVSVCAAPFILFAVSTVGYIVCAGSLLVVQIRDWFISVLISLWNKSSGKGPRERKKGPPVLRIRTQGLYKLIIRFCS